jgi:hypothetical protein
MTPDTLARDAAGPVALTDDQAETLARWLAGGRVAVRPPGLYLDAEARLGEYVLAALPVLRAARAQLEASDDALVAHVTEPNNDERGRQVGYLYMRTCGATEAAERCRRDGAP